MTRSHDTSIVGLLAALSLALLSLTSGCAQAPALDDGVAKASQLFRQGDHDGVIALLQPMADSDPKLSTTSLDLLGMAYYANHQYSEAAAILERATAPGMFSGIPFGGRRINMRNHGVLGWCYFHMQEPARAQAAFDKALAKSDFRRDPAWDESALRGRGWVRYSQGNFQDAANDMTAAQRLAKANPDISNAANNYDRHLVMAYISLGLQRDQAAEAMVQAAEAAAKSAGLDAGKVGKALAAVYLMLGQRDRAYRLWGASASLGIGLQDHRSGAQIVEVTPGSPAEQAGLLAGDVIVSLDGQTLASAKELTRRIGARQPGQSVQLAMLRNDSPIRLAVSLAGPDAVIARSHLLQPVLKARPLESAVAAVATDAPISGSTVPVTLPADPADPVIPQVEAPLPPQLRIEAVRVTPSPVPAGARMAVTLAMFASDQDVRETTIGVTRRYTIIKDGKELARFGPETFQVPNGAPSSITMNTHAAKTPGDYLIRLEVEMGAHTAQAEATFSIQ